MENKTDSKKADEKTLGKDAPKQVDVKTSASAMLDPADNTVIESGEMKIEGVTPGSSYPDAEALAREAEGKQKIIEERDEKAAEEAKKSSEEEKKSDEKTVPVVTRSALDHGQEAVVHPDALKKPVK